ncbi:hypothetical protein [Sphingomonas faeni]|uniref:hypothetical protein n=1 Tax=Sphingomonas faeni TaxID=185950 RepID=UPI00334A8889
MKNPGKFCSSCRMKALRADPEMEAKRVATFRARFADAEFKAKHCAASAERLAKWRATEEGSTFVNANSRANLVLANSPENTEKRIRNIRVALMGWCPEDRWDEYRKMARTMPAPEARRIIEADLAAKERARLKALSPFERDMERIAKGARIVEQFTPRKADHAFSIIGSSMA